MKILLIKPETVGIFSYTYLVEHEPLEMEYLYTIFTQHGYEAVIYDRRYDLTPLKKKLRRERPDVVCITGYITQQKLMIRYCDMIKSYDPKITIILGGSNVEINYENYYESKADYLYHLSGLDHLVRLVEYIDRSKRNSGSMMPENSDRIPAAKADEPRQAYIEYADETVYQESGQAGRADHETVEQVCVSVQNAIKQKQIKQNEIKQNEIKQNEIKWNEIRQKEIEQGEYVQLSDIPGICYRKDGEWVVNPKVIESPEALPIPDRTYFYKNIKRFRYLCFRPLALVKNSYSCRKACNFCFCTNRNSGRYACRSAESLVNEIASLDVPAIHITDDDFLVDREYLKEFIRLIREKNIHKKYLIYGRADFIAHNEDLIKELAEIGLALVMVGLEATNDEELNSYNKRVSLRENEECIRILSENHIFCAGLFIVHPQMTKEDFKRLYHWIAERDIIPTVSVFTPMQGSAMYRDYEKDMISRDATKQDLFHILLQPEHMSVGAFTRQYYKLSLGLAWKNRKSKLYADNNYFGAVCYIVKVLFVKLRRRIVL